MVDAFRFFPGAVDETGSMPFYAEECASMLAVTFSGGDKMMRSIVSTTQGTCLAPCSAGCTWPRGWNSPVWGRDEDPSLLIATHLP